MTTPRFTWTDRAWPVIQIGIGDERVERPGGQWDIARWDEPTAIWSGLEPEWRDVTCDAFNFRCEYGRARTTERFVPGAATIVVWNATGWADPRTDIEPGVLTMRPGRAIRVGVEHTTLGTRWLFRGFIDSLTPVYDPTQPDTVELSCIDALGEVNRAKVQPIDPPVGEGETVTARIHRLLDMAIWPTQKRAIAASADTLIADDMGGQIADLLGQAAESAGGSVYGDLNGDVVFRNRDWQMFDPSVPPDATIGNVGMGYVIPGAPQVDGYLAPPIATGGTSTLTDPRGRVWTVDQADAIVRKVPAVPDVVVPGDVCPVLWERPFARADMATRVIVGRDPLTALVLDDPIAQALYGIEPFERTDLLTESDATIELIAERIMAVRSAASAPRIRSVTLDARTADDALDLMASVDVYKPSRYRCRLQLPRGLVFDAEHLATGVVHEMTPNAWTLALNLDLAEPFEAIGGRWDGAYWDAALWGDDLLIGV